jgi:hypothetical protein
MANCERRREMDGRQGMKSYYSFYALRARATKLHYVSGCFFSHDTSS